MCDALTVDPIVEKEGGRRDIQKYVFEFRSNLWYGKGTGWISIVCLSYPMAPRTIQVI